jgi:molybdopterin-guanine dinucleotide biosynthesis protein A
MHGLILAGGRGRRMGGADKPLLVLAGQTLLDRIIARVRPQVGALSLSANGDPARFAAFGLPVLPDAAQDRGPLEGMLAGLRWAGAQGADFLLTVPGDTPFLPADLAARLRGCAARAAYATSNHRDHPTAALLATSLAADLETYLATGARAVLPFLRQNHAAPVDWDGHNPDPFLNINTPADLLTAAAWG